MKILAIETSCDESAIAVLDCSGTIDAPRFDVLASLVLSQANKHAEFGGVYPNLAKREHAQNLVPILEQVLKDAGLFTKAQSEISNDTRDELKEILEREPELFEQLWKFLQIITRPDIDAIAVTNGPGLEPALWVGVNLARALAAIWNIPVIPTNHMEGHIISVLVEHDHVSNSKEINFPALALLVSGGHTQLVRVNAWGNYEIIGETRDDAIGEAFDKVARMLGLPYPGGPAISKYAQLAREANDEAQIKLPRPMIDSDDLDFSYSGLKTAVLYAVRENELTEELVRTIAREFEDAAFDCIIAKTRKALDMLSVSDVIVGGGVIASSELRRRLAAIEGATIHLPDMSLTGDNAVMIGAAAYINHIIGTSPADTDLRANGNLRL